MYLYLFFSFFSDFKSRMAVIWISSPELGYVFTLIAMSICAPMWAENSSLRYLDDREAPWSRLLWTGLLCRKSAESCEVEPVLRHPSAGKLLTQQ